MDIGIHGCIQRPCLERHASIIRYGTIRAQSVYIYGSVPLMSDKEYEEMVRLAISETRVTRASSLG